MTTFTRSDNSIISRWWWTVDRWNLAAVMAMMVAGVLLALAASPAVAERIGLDTFYFARRQMAFLPMALAVMLAVSLLGPKGVKRIAGVLFLVSFAATIATLFTGPEIKGSTRWLHIAGQSVQPSEFLKPAFAVIAAWMFTTPMVAGKVPGQLAATLLAGLVLVVLVKQPDVGMSAVMFGTWAVQFFVAGLPLIFVGVIVVLAVAGVVGAYLTFDHVRGRVDGFLSPEGGEGYQVQRSLEAFSNGGLFGKGPGQGQVKMVLPDAHADFVFAVAGEEFGMVACLILVAIFAFVVLRGLSRAFGDEDMFVMVAAAGLLSQFGMQAIINMASSLHLIPPKGMTLPFMSYGGSSTMALAIGVGMVLALTRLRPGQGGGT